MKRAAIGFRAADQHLPVIKAFEQLGALVGADHRVRKLRPDLRQQVEFQQHALVGARQGMEEVPAEHIEQPVPAGGEIVGAARHDGAAFRQQHQADRPAARGGDVDLACALRAHLDQGARLGVREGERGLVDHHQLAAQRKLAQLVLRQGAGETDAADAIRQLAQHDRQHGAELWRVGIVQVVERQQRARLQMLEIGPEEHAGEFARPLGIFRAEHRHRLGHLFRSGACAPDSDRSGRCPGRPRRPGTRHRAPWCRAGSRPPPWSCHSRRGPRASTRRRATPRRSDHGRAAAAQCAPGAAQRALRRNEQTRLAAPMAR